MLGDELAQWAPRTSDARIADGELAAEVAERPGSDAPPAVDELADAAGQHDAGVARDRDRDVEQQRVDRAAQDDVLERAHEPCDDRGDVAARVVQQRAAERRRARRPRACPGGRGRAARRRAGSRRRRRRRRRPTAGFVVPPPMSRFSNGTSGRARESAPAAPANASQDSSTGSYATATTASPTRSRTSCGEPVGVRPPRGEAGDERASREDGRGVEARLGEPAVESAAIALRSRSSPRSGVRTGPRRWRTVRVVQGQATRDRIAREPRRRRQRARGRRADVESEQCDLAHGGDPAHR